MTRIKTIAFDDADEALRIAREAQHALYPSEYATPVRRSSPMKTASWPRIR